jgi:predicted phage gp36 major capsid-like protein
MATSVNRRRRSSRTSASIDAATQTQQSERAQAERFSELLRRELAELTEKLVAAEARWLRRCELGGYIDPPERVALIRRRVTDLEAMLKALGARFPRT